MKTAIIISDNFPNDSGLLIKLERNWNGGILSQRSQKRNFVRDAIA